MEEKYRLIHFVNDEQKEKLMRLMDNSEKTENSFSEIEAALNALQCRYQNTMPGQQTDFLTADQKKNIAAANKSLNLIFDDFDKFTIILEKAKELNHQGMLQMAIKERIDNSGIDKELSDAQTNLTNLAKLLPEFTPFFDKLNAEIIVMENIIKSGLN